MTGGLLSKTVNHRRLVQEVYDDQTIQELLGMERKPRVRDRNGAPGPSHTKEAQSVKEAWNEADASFESDIRINVPVPDRNIASEQQLAQTHSDGEVEESRYQRNEPKRKRQRTGHEWKDVHTVYVSDDEVVDSEDSLEMEEREYASRRTAGGAPKGLSHAERRAYWASKGVGTDADSE